MGYALTTETASVLHEIRPSPSMEELKSSLAPALAEIENQYAQLRAEEDSLRVQLDAKLDQVSVANVKLLRYQAAATELDQPVPQIQG